MLCTPPATWRLWRPSAGGKMTGELLVVAVQSSSMAGKEGLTVMGQLVLKPGSTGNFTGLNHRQTVRVVAL